MTTDKHLGKCKDCTKKDIKENRENNPHVREYDLERSKNPERKAYILETQRIRRAKYPEKEKAHAKVSRAIKSGILVKRPCKICGDFNSQAHHDDYNKPLDVSWLCQKHHDERHSKLGWG